MTPERVQLKRTNGWRMPPNTKKVDRSTGFGNPFAFVRETPEDARADSVAAFREWITAAMEGRPCATGTMFGWLDSQVGYPEANKIIERLQELRGKNLACWCPLDQPCHADVLLELANKDAD